jgi:hypothetical protein
VAAGAAVLTTAVAVVDPNEPGRYPTCPVLAVTGLFCPGCGALRALHALAHGDVATAVGLNALMVLAAVALVVGWGTWVARRWQGRPRVRVTPAPALYGLLVAVLVFTVLRNLPAGSALAP